MFCLKCGHEVPDEALFCLACGAELPKRPTAESAKPAPTVSETPAPEPVASEPIPAPAAPVPSAVPAPPTPEPEAPAPVAPVPVATPEPTAVASAPVATPVAPAPTPGAPVAVAASPDPAPKKSGAKWALIGGIGAVVLIALLAVGALLFFKSLQKNPIASTSDAINKFGNQQKSGFTVEASGQTVRGNWVLGNDFDDSYFYLDAGSGNKAGVHNGEAGIVSDSDYYEYYDLRNTLSDTLSGSGIDLSYSDLNGLIKNGKIDQDAVTKLSQKLSSEQSGSSTDSGLTTDQKNLLKELSDGKKSQQLFDGFIQTECSKKAVQDKFLSEVSKNKSGGVTTLQYTLDLKGFVMAFYDYAVNSNTLSASARNALKDSKDQIDSAIGGVTIKAGVSVKIASDGTLDELKIKNIPGLSGDITLRRDKNSLDTGAVDSLIKNAKDDRNSSGGTGID